MKIVNIDFDSLRNALINYFGTAIYSNPYAVADVINIDNVNDCDLIKIAIENGFNLEEFIIDDKTR